MMSVKYFVVRVMPKTPVSAHAQGAGLKTGIVQHGNIAG